MIQYKMYKCIRKSLEFWLRADKTIHHDPRDQDCVISPLLQIICPVQTSTSSTVKISDLLILYVYHVSESSWPEKSLTSTTISQYLTGWLDIEIKFLLLKFILIWVFDSVWLYPSYIMWKVKVSGCASQHSWLPIEFFQKCIFYFNVYFPKV